MANALFFDGLKVAGVTASSTAAGFTADNLLLDYIGLAWRSAAGAASRALVFDMGSDVAVTALAMFGLNGAQPGWAWSIDLATAAQGSFGGSFWAGASATLLAGSVMPSSGLGKALWQAPPGAPALARYVRVNMTSLGGAAAEVSRVVIGTGIQLERNFRFGAALGVRPLGTADFSIRGVLQRRRGKKLRGVGISFFHAKRDEVEAKVQPLLERVGNDAPMVLVTDPAADAQRQNRMYFGFLTGDLGTVWARPGGFTADFNLVALD